MKWSMMMSGILIGATLCAAEQSGKEELVFSGGTVDSLGRPVRVIERIREDGSGRVKLTNPDFIPERYWPGYRLAGPVSMISPSVSPLGKRIIFSNTHDIYATEWDGGNIFALTRFPKEKYMPRWSPDGKRIAFASDLDGHCEIYLMNPDGTGPKNITWHPSTNLSPTWSPDSERIAFISNRNGRYELFQIRLSDGTQKQICSMDGDIREPVWGIHNKIVFSIQNDTHSELWQVDPDHGKTELLLREKSWAGHPAWNADGTRLAYSSTRSGNADLWILDLKTKQTYNITNTTDCDEYFPAWVPKQHSGSPALLRKDSEAVAAAKMNPDGRDGERPVRPWPVSAALKQELPRPRLLFHKKDLDGIRARLQMPPYRNSFSAFMKKCDEILNPDSAESRRIRKSLQEIGKDELRKRYGNPVFYDLYLSASWVNAVYSLAFAWQLTDEEKYARRAVGILLESAELYRRHQGIYPCDYRIACAYDWLYSRIPNDKLASLNTLLIQSMRGKLQICLYEPSGLYGLFCGQGNYAIYYAASLGPIALAMEDQPGTDRNFLAASEQLARLTLNRWIGSEGAAEEGFSYFVHPIGELAPFLISMKRNGLDDGLSGSNLRKFPFWMTMSAGNGVTETIGLGDCDPLPLRIPSALTALYENDPAVQRLWNRVPRGTEPLPTVNELLWWRPSKAAPQDFSGYPRHALFPNAGYAVFRTGFGDKDSLLTVSAPQKSGHAHQEYGAITLSGFGQRFLTDPGQAVPNAEYHNQILVDGRGRAANSGRRPMLSAITESPLGMGITVDYKDYFASGIFGHDGYSEIPYGRTPLEKGLRAVILVHDPSDSSVPPYYLVYDHVRQFTAKPADGELLFLADQGMKIREFPDGTLRIAQEYQQPYPAALSMADTAEFRVSGKGTRKFHVWIYTKYMPEAIWEQNGKKQKLFCVLPPSRPGTWQWRPLEMNKKPFEAELSGSELIRFGSSGGHWLRIALTPVAERADLVGGSFDPVLSPDSVLLKIEQAKRLGNTWKQIPGDSSFLALLPLDGEKRGYVQENKNFLTRFHGQKKITLPQIRWKKPLPEFQFLTMLYAADSAAPFPKIVEPYQIKWPHVTDIISVNPDSIAVRRGGKEIKLKLPMLNFKKGNRQ